MSNWCILILGYISIRWCICLSGYTNWIYPSQITYVQSRIVKTFTKSHPSEWNLHNHKISVEKKTRGFTKAQLDINYCIVPAQSFFFNNEDNCIQYSFIMSALVDKIWTALNIYKFKQTHEDCTEVSILDSSITVSKMSLLIP